MTLPHDFAPLSPSLGLQQSWSDLLLKKASQIGVDADMSLTEALAMPLSFERLFYQSSAWQDRKKQQENRHVQFVDIAKQINQLAVIVSKRL
jgi:hypothetical protein